MVDGVYEASNKNAKNIGMMIASYDFCFGNGVDEPRFIIKNLPTSSLFVMGDDKSSAKIMMNDISYVKFKDHSFIEAINFCSGCTIDVYGRFSINEYRGRKSLQFLIEDYNVNEKVENEDDGF